MRISKVNEKRKHLNKHELGINVYLYSNLTWKIYDIIDNHYYFILFNNIIFSEQIIRISHSLKL